MIPSLFSSRALLVSLLIATLLPVPAVAEDSEAAQIFIAGFNAYHKKEYAAAVAQMETILKKYPKSSLRDMVLFWLAKGYYKKGDRREGAKTMAQFLHDYPDSSLKTAVDEELRDLATRYDKGEPLPPPRERKDAANGRATPAKTAGGAGK